jgi:hypothetical protein
LGSGFFFGAWAVVPRGAVLFAAGAGAGAAVTVAAAVAVGAGAGATTGVVAEAALVGGGAGMAAAGGGVPGAGVVAAVVAPQPLAEHDALPAGVLAVGVTSWTCTGCGVLPAQATRALVPRAARTVARFSKDRLGRMLIS